MREGDDCPQCGHLFDPHMVIGIKGDHQEGLSSENGGIILCPECDCYTTWSTSPGTRPTWSPDRFELEAIRERLFK